MSVMPTRSRLLWPRLWTMMADLFPADPKRIRERIRRYERALKRELEEGFDGDGYGKRFLPGPLYMLMGDVDGALA